MNPMIFGGIVGIFDKVLDKVFPDPEKKAAAQLQLLQMERNGELESTKVQLSAILSESQSADPWTSRARPSFMYVMYVMILMAIPMGVLSAFHPEIATAIAEGMKAWLTAIPDELYTLFGVGYLGYTGARSLDKFRKK